MSGWTTVGLVQPRFPRGGWCSSCGRGFTLDSDDSVHRVETLGEDRRCRTNEELLEKGTVLNESGLWGLAPREGGWSR